MYSWLGFDYWNVSLAWIYLWLFSALFLLSIATDQIVVGKWSCGAWDCWQMMQDCPELRSEGGDHEGDTSRLNAGMLRLTFDLVCTHLQLKLPPIFRSDISSNFNSCRHAFRYVLWLINKPNYSPGSILKSWLWQPRAEDGPSWSVDTARSPRW